MKFTLSVIFASALAAQTFETASIKPVADSSKCANSMIQPMMGSGLRIECLPLKAVIQWAYQIQNYQLSGGPTWLESLSWDIMAKSEPTDPSDTKKFEDQTEAERTQHMDDIRRRLRALLADRFQLQLRTDVKPQTVYFLTVAKSGIRMKEVERSGMIRRGRAQIVATGATMNLLSTYLGIAAGRPVTDKTGLTAYYAFELNWTPDGSDTSAPSLTTALQEQLGLRLEATKAPTESLIIERIERASEN